ncbi:MAG TPA: L,D-transpeptidase [Solirubrobacteraceae bacterium]
MTETSPHLHDGRRRWPLAAAVVVVALVPIIAGVAITSATVRAAPSANPYKPAAQIPTPSPSAGSSLPSGPGSLVALVRHSTTMHTSPRGRTFAKLPTKTEFGSPQALWVRAHRGNWLGVVSPLAGNGKLGWIPRSAVSLARESWELRVSLGRRQLTVLNNGKTQKRYTVAVGRPTAPTPTGSFAVTDRLDTGDPAGPYGCCILALSAKSPHAIQGWGGGDRIAIHSTPETSSIGLPVSHGCMRLSLAEGRWLLGHIPLGTPTVISS